MMKYNCETCKDTREYVGLNSVEPCRNCFGDVSMTPPGCGRPVEIGSTESLMASLARTGCLTLEERQKVKKYFEDHKGRVATKPIVLDRGPNPVSMTPAGCGPPVEMSYQDSAGLTKEEIQKVLNTLLNSPNPDLVFDAEREDG